MGPCVSRPGVLQLSKCLSRRERFRMLWRAVDNGQLERVQYYILRCTLAREDAQRLLQLAAVNDNVACLMFVYEHVTLKYAYNSLGACVLACASVGGSLECIKYLFTIHCPCDTWATTNAASYGHLDCLKYLHQMGCPWISETCFQAAYAGHLPCLIYAHCNGCPMTMEDGGDPHGLATFTTVTDAAISGCNMDCLQYAYNNGCPLVPTSYLSTDNVVFLRFLHEKGIEPEPFCLEDWLHEVTYEPCHHGLFQHLEFLYDIGCPYSKNYRRTIAKMVLLPKMRRWVRMRSIAVYWQDITGRSTYAPGGIGFRRDLEAYVAEFGYLCHFGEPCTVRLQRHVKNTV